MKIIHVVRGFRVRVWLIMIVNCRGFFEEGLSASIGGHSVLGIGFFVGHGVVLGWGADVVVDIPSRGGVIGVVVVVGCRGAVIGSVRVEIPGIVVLLHGFGCVRGKVWCVTILERRTLGEGHRPEVRFARWRRTLVEGACVV